MKPLILAAAAAAAAVLSLMASPALAATAAAHPRYIGIYSDIAGTCAGAPRAAGTVSAVDCNKRIPFSATRWTRRAATFRTRVGGLCLADASGAVVTRRCDGKAFQAWTQNSARELVNEASGQCLTLPAALPAPMEMAACTPPLDPDGEPQWWNLLRPQAA